MYVNLASPVSSCILAVHGEDGLDEDGVVEGVVEEGAARNSNDSVVDSVES